MATTAVTFVLNNLLPLLEKEIQLSEEVHREIQYIKEELEHMQSILQLADATDEVKENMKICIMQMRDVAYDAEDVLVEFMLRLAHDHGDGCLGLVCKIIECIMSFQARHEISSSIKLISGRIERIYKRLPSDPFTSLDQSSSSSVTARPTWHDPRADALLIEDNELVGFEEPMMELISLMVKDESELRTISVAGMAGLGKTTIVRKAYDNQQVKGHFRCHAWINVSESFEVKKLLKDLIRQLFEENEKKVPEELDTMNEHELRKEIKEFLTEKSYVIVFDDIWDIVVLEAFKYALPSSNSGTRIVVTTRSNDIASHCKATFGAGCDYDLKPLDQEKSLILFYKKAFGGKTCPPHLKDLSDRILARCEGSPLAIVSIGGLLATKDNTSTTDWQIVDQSLPELVTNEKFKSFNKVLSLSFNHLPYYLKPCFL